MKQTIYLLVILIPFFSASCSTNATRPTSSVQAQPTIAVTAIGVTLVASSTPNVNVASSPTQAVTLFTESGGDYCINLTPADFVDVIDNPYFPLLPGAKWEYEIRTGNGKKQTDTLEVQKEKRNVNGVQATVVRDTVKTGDQIVEDTFDWFAQDKYGNVWYVGEAVDNYVGGVLAGHGGSWEWGVDGALPGILMWADPSAHVNEEYRQEYYVGRAEDMGKVLSVNESVTVPFKPFDQVVKTLDFSKIEAGQEQKFYAPSIGLIQELDANANEQMVLIRTTLPAK
jgi:hypothetical protein